MASLINLSALTLNPQEALSASEAIFTKAFNKPALTDVHTVATGIKMQTQIPIYGRFGIVGKKSLGSCDDNDETVASVASQKYWTPQLINFRLTHCQENMNQLFKMWMRAQSALKTWEEMDSEQIAFLADLTVDATMESILRITSFGDTAALNVGGGGNITAGVSVLYFTMIDGLWKQIFTAVAAGSTPRYQITENGAATYATQNNLAADRALKVFRNLYEQADTRLLSDPDVKFQITNSLLFNWQAYLEDKSLAFTLQRAEEGATLYNYRGIPIVARDDWSRNILSYENTTVKLYLPHRAILAPINNIPVGTSDEGDMDDLDMFYHRKDKKHYTDVAYYIDQKVLEEHMISVAY